MKYLFLLILFVYTFSFASLAQTRGKLNIMQTIDCGSYFYIPPSALADSVDGIIHQTFLNHNINPSKSPIKFRWNAGVCTDGSYNLCITPKQVFFYSSHNNPNPNSLFLVMETDSIQYTQIKKGLLHRTPRGFEKLQTGKISNTFTFYDVAFKEHFAIPKNWNDSLSLQYDTYCSLQVKQQLKRYFTIINAYIKNPDKKIQLPAGEMKDKLFEMTEEEIYDHSPVLMEADKRNR